MIRILKQHLKNYPKMQIQDVVKLIYQNEFGGGHLIADSKKSLKRIQEEYQSLSQDVLHTLPVAEDIGNGMCRIYLSALEQGISAEVMNQLFVQSAASKKGSIRQLEYKLDMLVQTVRKGELPFAEEEVLAYIKEWKEQGYPAVSHSNIYRESYSPAYRVMEFPTIIAIDGMSGSGKSTLGNAFHQIFSESVLIHMDDYFLQPHQRTPERLAEVGGNVDYERFKKEIILHLNDKEGFICRKYNCSTQTLGEKITIPHEKMIIVEGSYSMHPYFGNYYQYGIFCEVTALEQKERILKRNGEYMWKRFENEWIPMENAYFEYFGIREKGGLN